MSIGQGLGTTVVFGTTAFTALTKTVTAYSRTRSVVDTSNLSTTDAMTSEPGDLRDEGDLTMEIFFDPDNDVPINQAPEEITITYPLRSGESTAAKTVGTGYVIAETPSAATFNEMISSVISIKWTGAVINTAAVPV